MAAAKKPAKKPAKKTSTKKRVIELPNRKRDQVKPKRNLELPNRKKDQVGSRSNSAYSRRAAGGDGYNWRKKRTR